MFTEKTRTVIWYLIPWLLLAAVMLQHFIQKHKRMRWRKGVQNFLSATSEDVWLVSDQKEWESRFFKKNPELKRVDVEPEGMGLTLPVLPRH